MVPDEWTYVWGDVEFRAKKYYDYYFHDIEPIPILPKIWKTKCMMKHKVFAWLLMIDKPNTRDMLVRQNCPVADVKCVVCQLYRETREHLFFSCSFSKACWHSLGITLNLNLGLSDMLASVERSWNKPLFLEVTILCAWNIWKQRNRKYFDGVSPSLQSWLAQLVCDLDILRSRVKIDLREDLNHFVRGLRV
jgi:hypothetical protein